MSSVIPEVLTTKEAAAACKCAKQTIIRMIEEGRLAAARLGGRGDYRITAESVARLLRGEAPKRNARRLPEPVFHNGGA